MHGKPALPPRARRQTRPAPRFFGAPRPGLDLLGYDGGLSTVRHRVARHAAAL